MNLGAPELLIILFLLVPLGVTIWGIVDAAGRPDGAWRAAGQNKGTWIALQAVGLLFCGVVGLVLAIVYLASIRPRVAAAQVRGPAPSPGVAPPPAGGWHPDPTGRHQHRYWDGARWTEHVSDGGIPGIDQV